MPSLKEILAQQKAAKEKMNGQGKSVLQSEAVIRQESKIQTQSAESTNRPNVPAVNADGDKQTTQNNSVLGSEGQREAPSAQNLVAQQQVLTPPPGLSGLALMKWRKEHAQKEANSAPAVLSGPVLGHTNDAISSTNVIPEAQITAQKPLTLAEKMRLKNANQNNSNSVPAPVARDVPATNPPASPVVSPAPTATIVPAPGLPKVGDNLVQPEALADLKSQLEYLANNIEQKELVGQIVRTIAVQLKKNRALTPLMTDGDIDLMVRGLRSSYATAARKKTEVREVKAGKNKQVDDLRSMLKDGGIDLGDFKL